MEEREERTPAENETVWTEAPSKGDRGPLHDDNDNDVNNNDNNDDIII